MNKKDKKELTAKIVIIGDIGVGKSSITIRYVFDKFDLNQQSTLGAAYMEKICTFHFVNPNQDNNKKYQQNKQQQIIKKTNHPDIHQQLNTNNSNSHNNKNNIHNLKLQIWDTAGQQKYKAIAKLYYRDCRVAILVYDIIKKQTFINLNNWYQELIKYAPKNIKFVVIGNKIDLLDFIIQPQAEPVSYKMGEQYAKSIGAIFGEVSAKNKKGIDQIFESIAQIIGPIVFREKKLKKQSLSKSILQDDSDDQKNKKKCCKN